MAEIEYESLPHSSWKANMMAGAVAGIMEHCVVYPMDVVKTRMQILQPVPGSSYSTIHESLYHIVKNEGMLRPFRGMSAVLMGAGPAHALYFSSYELIKKLMVNGSNETNHSPIAHAGAACVATLMHDSIMTPSDAVKQRLQVFGSPYKGFYDAASSVWKKEGLKAFYRSYTTQLLMNIPFQCTHLMTYELMQDITNYNRKFNPKAHMVSGAIAGGFAAAITTPLDVCKTLLNTQDHRTLATLQSQKITSLRLAIISVYKLQGFRGYFQGIRARVLFMMPGTAISWLVYESFKSFLNKS